MEVDEERLVRVASSMRLEGKELPSKIPWGVWLLVGSFGGGISLPPSKIQKLDWE